MKKRAKRRADYEKSMQLKKGGKKLDKQLTECVEQYEALNDALKKELPKLSALTEKVGNICLGNLVNIQTQWYSIWKEKVKTVLENPQVPEVSDIISTFQRDYRFQEEQVNSMSILNPGSKTRPSQSSIDDQSLRVRPRPSELSSIRGRGLSVNSDVAPSLPTPDFIKRHSGQFTVSPSVVSIPSPHQFYYRDYYAGASSNAHTGSATPNSIDPSAALRSPAPGTLRPGTGQSYDSSNAPRQSTDSTVQAKRYSNAAYPSGHQSPPEPSQNQRFSGLFSSAMPLPDTSERTTRQSRASSRASSRERQPINGYNVMWLAASLFEFNIETTKMEAGYPYLTYQAGEVSFSFLLFTISEVVLTGCRSLM
jgi:dynamin-binding protein